MIFHHDANAKAQSPQKRKFFVKLQACSKVITLNAIGFTLCAAGSLFTLSSAQQSIDDTYKNKVQSAISSANSDLTHYVHRIDNDYYQLVNMSLSNVLSLNREVYLKDPLLSFFEEYRAHVKLL